MFQLYCRCQRLTAVCGQHSRWHYVRVIGGYGLCCCGWILFAALWVAVGCYLHPQQAPAQVMESSLSDYALSPEHYVYKKSPLPAVEEVNEEPNEQSEASEAYEGSAVDMQNTTPENTSDDNAELKARVKQAMAEIQQ